eukprot:6271762-Amphidinium_carterae.1
MPPSEYTSKGTSRELLVAPGPNEFVKTAVESLAISSQASCQLGACIFGLHISRSCWQGDE